MRVKDLINRLYDNPFRGFRIHLSDGSTIAVAGPGMVIVGRSSAILPTEFGRADGERVVERWRTVALSHMVQFSDIDESVARSKDSESEIQRGGGCLLLGSHRRRHATRRSVE